MSDNNNDLVDFGGLQNEHSIIKVIGVGGGGGNAVNHMYREGIHDVTFVLCNTDKQALNDSPVPMHLQLGSEGLGAGNKPAKAREAAEESIEDIKNMLNDGTRMTFITAGMGGGTGTGAAPVIARPPWPCPRREPRHVPRLCPRQQTAVRPRGAARESTPTLRACRR